MLLYPYALCRDFDDLECPEAFNSDTCVNGSITKISDSSYNGSKCLHVHNCDSFGSFESFIQFRNMCNAEYRVTFYYKIAGPSDTTSLECFIKYPDYDILRFSNNNIREQYLQWQQASFIFNFSPDETLTSGIFFHITGSDIWIDDVSIKKF
ncbi:MAG: hypothetical protein H0W62_06865 [Chitinophagales bacterium]|nr:hypothetical protein [Chitinophagales bacterium]